MNCTEFNPEKQRLFLQNDDNIAINNRPATWLCNSLAGCCYPVPDKDILQNTLKLTSDLGNRILKIEMEEGDQKSTSTIQLRENFLKQLKVLPINERLFPLPTHAVLYNHDINRMTQHFNYSTSLRSKGMLWELYSSDQDSLCYDLLKTMQVEQREKETREISRSNPRLDDGLIQCSCSNLDPAASSSIEIQPCTQLRNRFAQESFQESIPSHSMQTIIEIDFKKLMAEEMFTRLLLTYQVNERLINSLQKAYIEVLSEPVDQTWEQLEKLLKNIDEQYDSPDVAAYTEAIRKKANFFINSTHGKTFLSN